MDQRSDETFMQAALHEAYKALQQDEVPVGAVLVHRGAIVGRGYNCPISRNDPTAHAEIIALRSGAASLGNYRLTDTELFVTVEPCIMCMGAAIHSRIRRLIFGARDVRSGAAGSVFEFSSDSRLNHSIAVCSGILSRECKAVMQDFFKQRR